MQCRNHSMPRRRTGAALLAHDRELAGRLLAAGTGTWALSKLVKQIVRRPGRGEQLSRLVDQDRLGGFLFGVIARSFDEFAVDEGRPGADQGDEVGRVDGAPAVLR
jgi:hypothetical protein